MPREHSTSKENAVLVLLFSACMLNYNTPRRGPEFQFSQLTATQLHAARDSMNFTPHLASKPSSTMFLQIPRSAQYCVGGSNMNKMAQPVKENCVLKAQNYSP